jgi:hypothetical protein
MAQAKRWILASGLLISALNQAHAQNGTIKVQQVLPNNAAVLTAASGTRGASITEVYQNGDHYAFKMVFSASRTALRIQFPTDLDASQFEGAILTVQNTSSVPLTLDFTFRGPVSGGTSEVGLGTWHTIPAGRTRDLLFWFSHHATNVPYRLGFAMPSTNEPFQYSNRLDQNVDRTKIRFLQFWNNSPTAATLDVKSIRLVTRRANYDKMIDRYGQINYYGFDRKVLTDEQLQGRAAEEAAQLNALSVIDPHGGTPGLSPTRATGRWRVERTPSGRFFAVTPTGKRTWIMGVNTVVDNGSSRVQNREVAYDYVPPRNSTNEEVFWLRRSHITDGLGYNFDFLRHNMFIKYGEDWREQNRNRIFNRLRRWGFNAVTGNQQADIHSRLDMPTIHMHNLWNFPQTFATPWIFHKAPSDIFHPDWEPYVESQLRPVVQSYTTSGLLGIQSDNELSWGLRGNARLQYSLPIGALNAAPTQPVKVAMLNWLKRKYGDNITRLNNAWGTSYGSFADLEPQNAFGNNNLSAGQRVDMSMLLSFYVDRYFSSVRRVLNRIGFRGLYLGTRDAHAGTPREVWRAAARYVDALTVNLYTENDDIWREIQGLPKPVLIGEYNYSSTDHGMFVWMQDLQCRDEQERAERNVMYLERAARSRNIIGACWWSYSEYSPMGRWWDDERLNTGLVDITDSPYQELVTGFRNFVLNLHRIRTP